MHFTLKQGVAEFNDKSGAVKCLYGTLWATIPNTDLVANTPHGKMKFAHLEALRTTVLVENDHWGGLISTSPDSNHPGMWGMTRKTLLTPKEDSPRAEWLTS